MVVPLLFAGFALFATHGSHAKAKVANDALTREFHLIAPLPGAVVRDSHPEPKERKTLVGESYATNQPFAEILAHYDHELRGRGWTYWRQRNIRNVGQDRGRKVVEYCKNGYRAEVEYAGKEARAEWDFAVELSRFDDLFAWERC